MRSTIPIGSPASATTSNQPNSDKTLGTTGALLNTDLTTRIRQDLMSDPRISSIAPGITVENINGQIILRGQVPTRTDQQDLISRVRTSSGIYNIDSQLTVAPTNR